MLHVNAHLKKTKKKIDTGIISEEVRNKSAYDVKENNIYIYIRNGKINKIDK